jgi:hypothetical protein
MTQENDQEKTDREPLPTTSRLDRLRGFYERRQRDRSHYHALEIRWSRIRLLVFLAAIVVVVLLRHDLPLATTALVIGLTAFATAILRHVKWEDRRAFVEQVLVVAEESLHAGTRRDKPVRAWQRPEDPPAPSASLPPVTESGPTWPLTDQERDDLDLYGLPVGVFGLLNRTSTPWGARRLRDMLDSPCLSGKHIQQRQDAVRWLDTHDEQRLELMAAIVPLRRHADRLDAMVQLLPATPEPPQSRLSQAVRLWSAVSGFLFLYFVLRIAGGQYAWLRPFLMLVTVNVLILLLLRPMLRRLNDAVSPWTPLRSTLSRLLAIAQRAGGELPEETPLGLLKGHFHRIIAEAHIPSLCGWLEWAGLHGMVRGLLNIIVFLDLHIAEAVLARIAPNRDVLLSGLSALAELEALGSLACFSAEQPVACYPQPTVGANDRSPLLSIQEGRHPLVLAQDAIPNGIHLTADKRTWVVTGPNAAGKSTFLRMVGVNTLLAQTGAAVAAREMTWSPVRLITDVRIRDDLAKHESYFLSEVRRLRRLVLEEKRGHSTFSAPACPGEPDSNEKVECPLFSPILGLIDEPFRGTNSQERTAGGIALLEHLMASPNLFLIATHEELLAQVAAHTATAQNYHFQEHLCDGGITFDYRLRPGPATTRTALRILEREGYPKTLLDRARSLMPPEP